MALLIAAPAQAGMIDSAKSAAIKTAQYADVAIDRALPIILLVGLAYTGYYKWTVDQILVEYLTELVANGVSQKIYVPLNSPKSYFTPIMVVSIIKIAKAAIKELATGKTPGVFNT